MAEVQSLFINANKFITAKTLWQRMDELLEWKHTKTFVPKGNKRLICLIDDINFCHVSKEFMVYPNQTKMDRSIISAMVCGTQ